MNIVAIKKKSYALFLLLLVFSLLNIKLPKKYNYPADQFLSFSKIALADNRSSEVDEEDYVAPVVQQAAPVVQSAPVDTSSSKPQTYKQIIQLPDQIVTSIVMENVILPDTDKDGIADVDDPHPTIPEYLIVQDLNGNGIDDRYDFSFVNDKNSDGVVDKYEKSV